MAGRHPIYFKCRYPRTELSGSLSSNGTSPIIHLVLILVYCMRTQDFHGCSSFCFDCCGNPVLGAPLIPSTHRTTITITGTSRFHRNVGPAWSSFIIPVECFTMFKWLFCLLPLIRFIYDFNPQVLFITTMFDLEMGPHEIPIDPDAGPRPPSALPRSVPATCLSSKAMNWLNHQRLGCLFWEQL